MYSPEIKEDLIREMYQIKLKTGRNIVQQANEAIEKHVMLWKEILRLQSCLDQIMKKKIIQEANSERKG